jgi:hypothetical protein
MAIQIKKVATLDNGMIYGPINDRSMGDLALAMSNLPDGAGDHSVKIPLLIGGDSPDFPLRRIEIDVPFRHEWLNTDDVFWLRPPIDSPLIHVVCRGHIFSVTGVFAPERDFEFIRLEVRRQLLEESQDLAELRRIVTNLERAQGNLITSAERLPIPSDVKIAVWARDKGRCVMCGSGERLQFDHVIPVVKGGANSFENIQILCQSCNLQKSDRIV